MKASSKKIIALVIAVAVLVGTIGWFAAQYMAHPEPTEPPPPHAIVAPPVGNTVATKSGARELRVCADPNNMPFTNDKGEGFENHIAELLGNALGEPVHYYWRPQRRGFIRNTLKMGYCDVVLGVPSSFELARPTIPYYRSTYVFLTRKDRHLRIASLDDPQLRHLGIGLQITGDDYSNPPAEQALAKRNIVKNVVGYSIYGDYTQPNPPARLVEAVAHGDVDVAIVWGPLAGYFASRQNTPLEMTPVTPIVDLPFTLFVYDISMGVRSGNDTLRVRLDNIIRRRSPEIRKILEQYGVPLLDGGAGAPGSAAPQPQTM